MGQAMAAFDRTKTAGPAQNADPAQYLANRLDAGSRLAPPLLCAKCGADDDKMIEMVGEAPSAGGQGRTRTYFCNICSHEWTVALEPVGRFTSIEQLVQRTGLRRDELATLADIGALNAFTHDRRSALWQVERAVRPAGELFQEGEHDREDAIAPLAAMNPDERLQADYAGMGLTIGPHPMALHRSTLALRGVLRASDLPQARDGRRVRVAGMVITRQRPGTAKGFVFLTLEDETGISNVIIRPDLFDRQRSRGHPASRSLSWTVCCSTRMA